jgi:lipid-A-disaccharide synthase-like uncharacterized protein
MEVQVLPAVFWLKSIFGSAALICAIVAMATNHLNKGLALLVGAAAAIALLYLVEGQMAHNAAQEAIEALNKQSIEMRQQIQQMIKLPNRAN